MKTLDTDWFSYVRPKQNLLTKGGLNSAPEKEVYICGQ